MENRECEYNLLDEPWIRVMKDDGTVEEVSLTDVFARAHLYKDLGGELPAQDIAVLRLLLAVLHTVFSRVDTQGEPAPVKDVDDALDCWKALWKEKRFPAEPVAHYLQTQKEKFWLFHPQRPFWQALSAAKGTEYSASKLIGELSESNNKTRLFPPRTGREKEELSYGEAARWLLYINGFDDTSAKPKGKNLPTPGAGWLGKLGLITAKGKNLFETLMLNLVLLQKSSEGGEVWGENVPVWELPHAREAERVEIVLPDNPAELLTLQSRRLLLERQDGHVTGFRLLGGDFFEKENAFAEQMTVWKPVKNKGKETGQYQPKRHDPSKQMWRDFASIAEQAAGKRLPGIVSWISLLEDKGILEQNQMVCFEIASVQYGDKDFFVTDVFSDSLSLYAEILTEAGNTLRRLVLDEIIRCENIANHIGWLAKDLTKAAGGNKDAASSSAKEEFYFRLDIPFRKWLASLSPDKNNVESKITLQEQWQKTVKKTARALAEELTVNAGTDAFAGRAIKEKIKGKEVINYYCAPKAYNRFLYYLKKTMGQEE